MGRGVAGSIQRVMHFFLPKEEDFFELFEAMSAKATDGAKVLASVLHGTVTADAAVETIAVLEESVDDLNHACVQRLNDTFVTPIMFDRQDILDLSHHLDEIVDQTRAAIDRMSLYKVKAVPEAAQHLGDLLVAATEALRTVCGELHSLRTAQHAMIEKVNALENEGDRVLKQGLADLFQTGADPIEVIKWKEIYDYIEEAIDECEDVVQTIEASLVKNS